MSNEKLIEFYTQKINNIKIETVNARELHFKLKSKRQFANWIQERIETYNFQDGEDFLTNLLKTNGRPLKEYFLTVEMAKELCMLENNEIGRQWRKYFIEKEKVSYKSKLTNTPINKLQSILKDAECILTFQDLINISHKQNVKEVCQFLTVKVFTQKGNISNWLSEAENTQEIMRIC